MKVQGGLNDKAYFCIISSWYHFLGACSYFESFDSRSEKIVVLVHGFFNKKPDIDAGKFRKYFDEVVLVDDLAEALESLREELFVTVVSPFRTPFHVSRSLRRLGVGHDFVVVEEGIGTYGGGLQTVRAVVREARVTKGRMALVSLLLFGVKFGFKYLYFLKYKKKFWFNFDRSGLVVNSYVQEHYAKAFTWVASGSPCLGPDFGIEKSLIFVSSPFLELKLCESDEYMSLVDWVFSQADAEEKVYVKPHPIECADKYGSKLVISPRIPFELILSQLLECGVRIYSFSSTSVYTVYILFGIKTYRIARFDLFWEGLSAPQKRIIERCSVAVDVD